MCAPVQPSHELRGERRANPCAGILASRSGSILAMHRVLATLVATALLIGCGKQSTADLYLASGEAHAAAAKVATEAADALVTTALDNGPIDNVTSNTIFWLRARAIELSAAAEDATEAAEAAEAAEGGRSKDKFFFADNIAAEVRKRTLSVDPAGNDRKLARLLSAASAAIEEASRKAWKAAQRASASHD